MNGYDCFYGEVPLPDGRIVSATLYGINHPNTWWEPGYFEIAESCSLEVEGPISLEEEEVLADYIADWLIRNGTFEAWAPDEDDYF